MIYTTTMTSKGQITVPATIRKKLGLKPGAIISISEKGNTAVIKANTWESDLKALQGRMQSHLQTHNIKPLTNQQLDDSINQAAQDEAIKRYERSQEN